MALLEHLMSVGTGNGVVSVWDRRTGRYLESPAADLTAAAAAAAEAPPTTAPPVATPPEVPSSKPLALDLAGGFLERNETYT